MDADIQITVGTAQTNWFSCQVCDSVTLSFGILQLDLNLKNIPRVHVGQV